MSRGADMEDGKPSDAILEILRLWLRNLHRWPGCFEIGDVNFVEPARDLEQAKENASRLMLSALADYLVRIEGARTEQEVVDVLSESADDLRAYADMIEGDVHQAVGQGLEECPDCKRDLPKRDA